MKNGKKPPVCKECGKVARFRCRVMARSSYMESVYYVCSRDLPKLIGQDTDANITVLVTNAVLQ